MCTNKINQLEKERKPIMYIEIRHNSFDISSISKIIKTKKNIFFSYIIKMVITTAEAYENATVHTIKVINKKLFWLKMTDIQDVLFIKNI